MEGYLTTAEAGDLLGVSASRVRQFILQGRLVAQKVGSKTLIVSARDVAKFRAKGRKKHKSAKKSNGNGQR
jgi:excisionase family DNA binding protein